MIVVPPITMTDAKLTSYAVTEPYAPSNYSAGTTYAYAAIISYNNITYQSLQGSNVGHTPDTSPDWWQRIGYKEANWASGTTYALGDYAVLNHKVYESLQASNTGKNPLNSPTWWSEVGPTNKWGMFDYLRTTKTVAASPLAITIAPGTRIDTVAGIGLVADSMRVQVYNGVTLIYDQTQDLLSYAGIYDWYTYFTTSFSQKGSAIFTNLPTITGASIVVTFTKATGNVEVGGLILGKSVDIGAIQYGAVDDALNFSKIERDVFGNSSLTQRRTVPKTDQTLWAKYSLLQNIRAVRESLNAVPALWAGVSDDESQVFDSLLVFGVYKQFSINVANTSHAVITLELEEM